MSAAMNWVVFIPWALPVFNADGWGCWTRGQGTRKSWWAGGSLCGCRSSFLSPFRWWGGFVQPELPVSLVGVFCFGCVLLRFEKTHKWKTEKAVIGETIPTNSHTGWACYKIHLQEYKSHWVGQKRAQLILEAGECCKTGAHVKGCFPLLLQLCLGQECLCFY